MENSTLISLGALIVAILSLPTSYFVAVSQVKVGLDENERRSKEKARFLVADRLDEFFNVFNSAVKQVTGIEPNELRHRLKDINPHMQNIDALVSKTGVIGRLALAIDELAATSYADLPQPSDLVSRIQSIRGQIALGSDDTRYATLGVISTCSGADIQSILRKP